MTEIFSKGAEFGVRTAADPIIALEKIKALRPDVIVLDLELPRMDGMSFLRKIMREDPLPVIICSAFAAKGTERAIAALEEGAVEIFPKPTVGLREFFAGSAELLVEMVRGAVGARVRPPAREKRTASAVLPRVSVPPVPGGGRLVAIGASAGGTDAIRQIVDALPHGAPPVVIVQHMPAEFVEPFGASLRRHCRLEVKIARDGESLRPGSVVLAPGHAHTVVHRDGDTYVVDLVDGPRASGHRPSVDVLFRSVAGAAGAAAVGVLLTGMGNDGAAGLLELRNVGAYTIAQDEATCVVYGMPKAAIARGAACTVAPLGQIAKFIIDSGARDSKRP
jgi:two-component system chemotaxis response regulator CheB